MPETLAVLGRQRDRWQRGLADVAWRYRDVVLRRRYGTLGLVALPFFILVELLGPVVEVIGLIGLILALALGLVDGSFALLFLMLAYGFGVLLSLLTLVLDEFSFQRYTRVSDRLMMIPWALLECVGYRQLTAYWRIRGLVKFLRGNTEWGAMTRTGLASSEMTSEGPPAH